MQAIRQPRRQVGHGNADRQAGQRRQAKAGRERQRRQERARQAGQREQSQGVMQAG
jgi:hypothetical protein